MNQWEKIICLVFRKKKSSHYNIKKLYGKGILLPKLFWPTERKKCCCDREKLLKLEAEGQEFSKFLRSLRTIYSNSKGQNNFC